jgi:NagD protein
MMRTGLRILNCHSAEAVMVGDRMDTDVITGLESGMSTVLVLSGISTQETLKEYAYRPSVVLNGVGDIPRLAAEAMQKGANQGASGKANATITETAGK